MRGAALAMALALAAGPSLAVPSADQPFDPNEPAFAELALARADIAVERWDDARARLRALTAIAPEAPELWSLLGFSLRKQGALAEAERAYDRALALDADHRGALEYMGELRLMQDDLPAAEALLARLARLCPNGCEERDELAASIRAHREAPLP